MIKVLEKNSGGWFHMTQLKVKKTEITQEVATETDHLSLGQGYFDPVFFWLFGIGVI